MRSKGIFILMIFIFIGTAGATISQDYLTEFNVEGETCEIIDAFIYDIQDPILFDADNKYTTLPVIYNCCLEESCTSIIFDVENKIFLKDLYMGEIIDLNYIRYQLYGGNLSENYFLISGLDLCDYFGFKEAKQQTLNLASEVVESGLIVSGTEKAYRVSTTIKTARNVGVIGKFNPAILIAGVGCNYDDKKLDSVLENVVILNAYLKNIKEGYSQEGYVSDLTNSIYLSKSSLEEYVESPTAMARGATSWILNLFKFLFNTASSPQEPHEIEKTKYQVAQETLKEISNYNFYLSNPNKEEIITENNVRLNLKDYQFKEAYNLFNKKYKSISNLKPSPLNVIFINLFYTPNYNLRAGDSCFAQLKTNKKLSERYYEEYKFNSATKIISFSEELFNCSKNVFTGESKIEREFDMGWVWLIIIILILVVIIKSNVIEKIKDFFK